MDFLDEIVPSIRRAIAQGHYDVPNAAFEQVSLRAVLESKPFSLIPVIEHRSPVEQRLFEGDVSKLANQLARAGADGLSVVCEKFLFEGALRDLALAKNEKLPVLYKDFVIEPLQIEAAKKSGADAILLIMSLFDKGHASLSLDEAIDFCHHQRLETLLEVFTLEEFEASKRTESDMVGINNRNLKTLKVDLKTTAKILSKSRPDRPVISESGVRTRSDMLHLMATGAKGVLVGTAILKAPDPAQKIRELLGVAK